MIIQSEQLQKTIASAQEVGFDQEIIDSYLQDIDSGEETEEGVIELIGRKLTAWRMGLPPLSIYIGDVEGKDESLNCILTLCGPSLSVDFYQPFAQFEFWEVQEELVEDKKGFSFAPGHIGTKSPLGHQAFIWTGHVLIDVLMDRVMYYRNEEELQKVLACCPHLTVPLGPL